jgi:leucyl-tRNA synthetase
MDYCIKLKHGKKSSAKIQSKINKAVKQITDDIENFRYNLATIKIRVLFDSLPGEDVSKEDLQICLKLFSPFCPHISEELWTKVGGKGFVSLSEWPVADEKKANMAYEVEKAEGAIDKLSADVNSIVKIVNEKNKHVSRAFIYVLPQEEKNFSGALETIKKKTGLDVFIVPVNVKEKYDPEGKSRKVKPGRPGIFVE